MIEQIPLYVGIPLAILCVAVSGVAFILGLAIWRDKR